MQNIRDRSFLSWLEPSCFIPQWEISHLMGANEILNLFRNNVIPVLVDIIRNSQKEKVTRIILATLRVSVDKNFFVKLSPEKYLSFLYKLRQAI